MDGRLPLPAQDSLAELRAVISEHLKIFLTPNNSEEYTTPKPLAPLENALSELREWRHSRRRIGVSTTAPAVSLRDEVATEIAARLHSNPSQDASSTPLARMTVQRQPALVSPPAMKEWNALVPA